jgi:hypothetical protein
METILQTKVTTENQNEFYKSLYHVDKNLVALPTICADQYVLVDCDGRQYCAQYPNLNITVLTTITTAKQFRLPRNQFDYLIDNQIFNSIKWPTLSIKNKCAVIFDYSPLIKYLTVPEIVTILETIANQYRPGVILIRSLLFFIDDDRMSDRFYNLINIKVDNYVVEKFCYDATSGEFLVQFKIKNVYDYTN